MAIKTGEGTASLIGELLREAFRIPFVAPGQCYNTRCSAFANGSPRRVNGGVFLGLNGTVVKSHGGADATGVSAAVKLAFQLAQTGFTKKLALRVASAATLTQDGSAKDVGPQND